MRTCRRCEPPPSNAATCNSRSTRPAPLNRKKWSTSAHKSPAKIQSLGVDPRDAKRTIDYGSPVNVGTVLARIDDSLYQSDVEQAQAQVDSAQAFAESTAAQVLEAEANVERAEKDLLQMQAKLFQAERDWDRAQGLWKSSPGAISESDYDLARSTYEAADATVGVGAAPSPRPMPVWRTRRPLSPSRTPT